MSKCHFQGDSSQSCGGESSHASIFVSTCPPGQVRFGEACLEALEGMESIRDNQDRCMNKVSYTVQIFPNLYDVCLFQLDDLSIKITPHDNSLLKI